MSSSNSITATTTTNIRNNKTLNEHDYMSFGEMYNEMYACALRYVTCWASAVVL